MTHIQEPYTDILRVGLYRITVAVSLLSTVCKGVQLRVLLGVPLFAACIQVVEYAWIPAATMNRLFWLFFQPTRLS